MSAPDAGPRRPEGREARGGDDRRPEWCRPENEDDDGYDPWSDRRPDPEPLFEEDPWS